METGENLISSSRTGALEIKACGLIDRSASTYSRFTIFNEEKVRQDRTYVTKHLCFSIELRRYRGTEVDIYEGIATRKPQNLVCSDKFRTTKESQNVRQKRSCLLSKCQILTYICLYNSTIRIINKKKLNN